jgi:hypothetical protein
MHVEPHVRKLAGELRACIDEARARQRDGGAFKVSSATARQAMY